MVWRDEEAYLWPANQNTSQGDPIVGKEGYPDDATDIGTKVYGNDKERDTGRKNTVCSHFMHVLTGTLAEPPQPTVDPSRNRTAEVARKVFNKFYFSVSTARGLLRCLRLSCIPVCLHVADYCFFYLSLPLMLLLFDLGPFYLQHFRLLGFGLPSDLL